MKYSFALASLAAVMAAACAGTPSQSASASSGPSVEVTPGAGLQAGASGPIQVADTSLSDPNKEICKKMDPYTGSRVGGRTVCMTQAQWTERERAAREFATDAASNGKWNLDKGD